jgi:prepilin-type processing-associated H-X9-DG protein
LALAVQNYCGAKKRLPASGLVGPLTTGTGVFVVTKNYWDARSGKMFSWITQILPYSEESALYERFDFSVSVLAQPREPQETHIPMLLCPSDSASERLFTSAGLTSGKRFAKGNYAAWASPDHLDLQAIWPGALSDQPQHLQKITDGLSKTLLLGEVRTRDYLLDQRGAWALPWVGASLLAFDAHPEDISISANGNDRTIFRTSASSIQAPQSPNGIYPDTLYDCSDAAKAQLENMPCVPMQGNLNAYYTAAPRSLHLGGVNVAFLDGHVEFLIETIDKVTMAYMVSINDGRRIDWK